MKHKGTVLLCAACLVFTGAVVAMPASTADCEPVIIDSGTCGENLTWKYDAVTAALTIEGTGDMYDWNSDSPAPWFSDSYYPIRSVVIKNGVTSIGTYAFYSKTKLTDIEIPNSLKSIGNHAFEKAGLYQVIIPKSVDIIEDYAFYMAESLRLVVILNPDIAFDNSSNIFYNHHSTRCDFDGNWSTIEGFSGMLYGYNNSTAKTYAQNLESTQAGDHITPTEQITVLKAMWKDEIAPTYLAGELDGKNGITADDAQITLMAAVNVLANKPSGLTAAQALAADVDENDKITAEDAQYILIYAIQDLANNNPRWSDIIK